MDALKKFESPCRLLDTIIGHFGEESFQAITCTGTDNTKQTGENTPKTHKKINKLALAK